MLSKEEIEKTLNSLYIREQWKTMLTGLFSENGGEVTWENQPFEISLNTKAAAYRAKNCFRLGSITLADAKIINVYEAEVQNTHIAENRVGLRSLIQSEIIPGFNDAAVAVFHSNEQTEWRFTFMSKWEYPEASGKIVKHETHPKKFTYVLGPTESNRTARDRFYELQAKQTILLSVIDAFSVSKLSDEFFKDYKECYNAFYDYLKNSTYRRSVFKIPKHKNAAENDLAEKPIRDFIKRLLGRIVFLYFLQKKGWMQSIWAEPPEVKPDHTFMTHLFQFADRKKDFYSTFLVPLFFDTLNNAKRKDEVYKVEGEVLGKIPYLNGGLFETDFKGVEEIEFKNELFEKLFQFFDSFNFTIVEDSPDEREVAVDPEMLGHIFENLIEENKKFGTFYTPKEVVHFMTQEALLLHLAKNLSLHQGSEKWKSLQRFVQHKEHDSYISSVAVKINHFLDVVKICDPAIGSGAFPMGILQEIFLMKWFLNPILQAGNFNAAETKERIIRNSIYGVDIDKGAIDIARLRFWLSLIVDLPQPRPLPNFDYKFMQGDSLKEEFEGIRLKLNEDKKETKNTNLFGDLNEPESFYSFLYNSNIDLGKLEEDLFDAHDEKIKAEKRKELNKIEKAYIKSCIDDKLKDLKTRIENEWTDYRKRTAGLSANQRDTLKASYQKRVDKLQAGTDEFKEKAQRLKEFDEYEKKYFLWHLYFKHVFDNCGFDIVIANPPYGVKIDDEFYKQSDLGSKDSYGFFIKLAIETLLKPNGTLVYIVSDTWLTIKSHLQLRQMVLKNQLHKIVRLHPDTFGAVVNTSIFSLSIKPSSEGNELIAADLTNLSTRKSLPEFREKLFHLDEFAGDFNESYAVYKYPQQLISTNSNVPIFTASPKLFELMNDCTCEKEQRKIKDGEEEKQIEIRKIKLNNKEIELVRFGDVADVKVGLQTGDNHYYLYQNSEVHGNYIDISEYKNFLLKKDDLEKIRNNEEVRLKVIEKGLHQTKDERGFDKDRWFDGRYIVPYDKGGESKTEEGWLPNYYVPTEYFIDWSSKAAKHLINASLIRNSSTTPYPRNQEFYFRNGITFSSRGMYSPTFRLNHPGPFDKESSCIFFPNENFIIPLIGVLNSKLNKFFLRNYIIHTVSTEVDALKELLVKIDNNKIESFVLSIIAKQKSDLKYQYFANEQKEIDSLVYELYGLNQEDIQEVEYWWARRYPKLARFADTKPRLSIKDKQEKIARLQEIITRGENKYCEFKSSLRLDLRNNIVDKKIEHTAFKNIAGFLNSEGGTLIIGVDDDKNILGLEETDYKTFSKADKVDEWSKHLDNLIQNFIGNKMHAFINAPEFIPIDGKTIVLIEVKPSPEPVWLKNGNIEEFYIRRTASAIQLSGKEAVEYIGERFKKLV